MIWMLEFALAAGLAGLVIPPAVWVTTVLIPITRCCCCRPLSALDEPAAG